MTLTNAGSDACSGRCSTGEQKDVVGGDTAWLVVVQLVWAAGNSTGTALALDEFYTNQLVKDYYKNFVSFMLNHVNKQTGYQLKVCHPLCSCV